MHIMHGEEMGSSSFFGSDMVDICACDAKATFGGWTTASAVAAFFDWTKVFGIHGVAEVDGATGGDGIAETLLSQYGWRGGSRGLRRF